MSTMHVADRTSDRDVDVRFATQVSSLGSLLDDVVTDLIRAEAGVADVRESESLKRFGALLHRTVEQPTTTSGLWRRNVLDDTLRRLTPGGVPATSQPPVAGPSEPLAQLLKLLDDAIAGEAQTSALEALRVRTAEFANLTLDEANRSLRNRSSAVSWLAP